MSGSRSLLLDAAAQEFAVRGLHGTRVQAIVKRAGVNERMIYDHFGSKEGLYLAVLQDQRTGLAEAWLPSLRAAAALAPYAGMRMILTGFFDALTARPLSVALLLHEALSGQQQGLSAQLTVDMLPRPMRELYERGQSDGTFRTDCPFETAYATAIGAVVGLVIFRPLAASPVPRVGERADQLRDQVIGQLLDGMTGPTA